MRGHLVKRSKGSWSIVLDLPRDPETGKRQQQWVSVKGTRKDAERRLAELLHQVDTGGFVRPSKLTVGEFLRQWLRDYAMVNVRPVTAEGYKKKVEKHIIPRLGHIPVCELHPSDLQGFYRARLNSGLSPRTVQHLHRILHNALSHAVKWGLVGRNIAEAVDPPRAVNKEMRTLSPEGVKQLLEASRNSSYYPLIHLAVYTGLRRSEILGLRWRNVDLDMSSLSVVQVLHYLQGPRFVFQEPKSQKGKRQVALSPAAVIALREYRERKEVERLLIGKPLTPDDLVFSNPDGSPLLPNTVTHAFIKIVRCAGLSGIRLHDLRHTHASLMLKQGIHPKIVSERLGHSTVGITLDTYSHVTPGLQEAAARRFEEGLRFTVRATQSEEAYCQNDEEIKHSHEEVL